MKIVCNLNVFKFICPNPVSKPVRYCTRCTQSRDRGLAPRCGSTLGRRERETDNTHALQGVLQLCDEDRDIVSH